MVYNLSHVGLCIYLYVCSTYNVESICKKAKAFSRGKVKCNFKMKKIFSNLIKMIKITKSRNFVFFYNWGWILDLKIGVKGLEKVFVESLSLNVLETILLDFLWFFDWVCRNLWENYKNCFKNVSKNYNTWGIPLNPLRDPFVNAIYNF